MKRRTLATVREEKASAPSEMALYGLVALVSVACYVNGFSGDFVHDDIPAITMNGDVLAHNPLSHVFKNDFWGTPMADVNSHKSYRPLTTLTFRLVFIYTGSSLLTTVQLANEVQGRISVVSWEQPVLLFLISNISVSYLFDKVV